MPLHDTLPTVFPNAVNAALWCFVVYSKMVSEISDVERTHPPLPFYTHCSITRPPPPYTPLTRHKIMPPVLFSTQSLTSMSPRSVVTYILSPTPLNPLTYPLASPLASASISRKPIHTRRVGLLTKCIFCNTGSLFQYLSPTHKRRDAMFACVMMDSLLPVCISISISVLVLVLVFVLDGSEDWDWYWYSGSAGSRMGLRCEGGGGTGPPMVTEETYPERWSWSIRVWWRVVQGMEVRPRRALEAFWRWEQQWARLTRDILAEGGFGVEVGMEGGEAARWRGWVG